MKHLDAEEILLGELLSGAKDFGTVAEQFSIDDFPRPEHKQIIKRIAQLYEIGARIDRITVANELMKHGELESCGGLSYLVSLDDVPSGDARSSRVVAFLKGARIDPEAHTQKFYRGIPLPLPEEGRIRERFKEITARLHNLQQQMLELMAEVARLK